MDADGSRVASRCDRTASNFRERSAGRIDGIGRHIAGVEIWRISEPPRGFEGNAARSAGPVASRSNDSADAGQCPGCGVYGIGRDIIAAGPDVRESSGGINAYG